MYHGFSGHLFSESFLTQHLAEHPVDLSSPERRALVGWRTRCHALGPSSALRALVDLGAAPLLTALGFHGIEGVSASPGCLVGTVTGASVPVTVAVTGWGQRLDSFWREALAQSRHRHASWCVLFNGTHVRLIETERVYARRFVEFDLDLALDDEQTLGALWTILQASGFNSATEGRSSLHRLLDLSERHATAVSESLKDGVLAASRSVLTALVSRSSSRTLDGAFEQALTLVYRMLFLLFAEARGLAPMWHPVYRDSYSIAAMRDAAEAAGPSMGFWDALRAVSRMAHTGCHAGSLRVTAFNGRLFAPSRTPLADRRDLDDEAARAAVLALSTRAAPDGAGQERIAYRDLGVEQLGAVYETLLDYEPRFDPLPASELPRTPRGSRARVAVTLQPGSHLRKATGTFYTPPPIADYLVRRTLEPLVAGAATEGILQLKVLDPAMGSGAFLVSACSYLAQAYERALISAGGCHPSDLGPPERVAIRRTIAERCLYGVDLNPMAVQLARLSLWLATLAADKPLSFLDHHLQTGDSLLGAWLSCLRSDPTGRRRPRQDTATRPLFEEASFGDALREALPVRFTLAEVADDSLEHVRAKERALAALGARDTPLSRWKQIADLWCARWFSSHASLTGGAFRDIADAILTGRSSLPASTVLDCRAQVERVASRRRFFHWELEFPEVFFGADGTRLDAPGFHAVLGNPPWDMIRADSGPADSRAGARADLDGTLGFTRGSGAYCCQSDGHANRYQLFVERAVALTRPGGRVGLVLPSGLATDHGNARLRRLLFSACDVDALVGFENRQRVFPIHRSVRFILATATRGRPTTRIGCRLGEVDPAILERANDDDAGDSWFTVHLSTDVLRQLSGDDLAVPDIRAPIDLAIAERAAALFPPLGSDDGWGARFGRELNATEDRGRFHPPGHGLPIVEGKAIEPFRANLDQARWSIRRVDLDRLLGSRQLRARLGYRDVASATNRQTLIAAVLPAGCATTHTAFCLRTPLPSRAQHFLCGLFNSFVVNYLVRLRVTTHVTTGIVERLPVPPREHAPAAFEEIAALARLLARGRSARAATDGSASSALARLNARVGHLYQLTPEEFAHVLATFPLIPREQREAARRAFVDWR